MPQWMRTLLYGRIQPLSTIEFKPGDKIVFSGHGWESALINFGSWGIPSCNGYCPPRIVGASHVAGITQIDRQLYLAESTTDDDCPLPCAITGKRVNGVQCHGIKERISSYRGHVWHYPLVTELYDDQIERSGRFILGKLGTSYDEKGAIECGLLSWTYSLSYVARWLSDEALESLYCSELWAAHDSRVGIWKTDNASLWSPNRLIRTQRKQSILRKGILIQCDM